MEMNELLQLITVYGPWPLVLALVAYVVLNGSFTFSYPRRRDRDNSTITRLLMFM